MLVLVPTGHWGITKICVCAELPIFNKEQKFGLAYWHLTSRINEGDFKQRVSYCITHTYLEWFVTNKGVEPHTTHLIGKWFNHSVLFQCYPASPWIRYFGAVKNLESMCKAKQHWDCKINHGNEMLVKSKAKSILKVWKSVNYLPFDQWSSWIFCIFFLFLLEPNSAVVGN